MNILQQSLLAIAIIFLAWFFLLGGDQALGAKISPVTLAAAPENASVQFASQHGDKLLQYNDPQHNFSIKYPIGYAALVDPDPVTRLAFTAFNPDGLPETFTVQVLKEGYSDAKFEQDAGTYPYQDPDTKLSYSLDSRRKTKINNRDAWVFDVTEKDADGYTVKQKIAAVQCSDNAVIMNAQVPQELEQDQTVIDFMMNSFTC
ncbi:MAG TPA: hypothetical protein VGQ00_02415 [Candidatus Norongarragalinales archaeon]|jgi:hypothetical protein|nr:hypothetical protein [Candidatus Norongarragalinales archaeon]